MSFGLMSFGVMSFGILSVYYIHTLGLTASSKCAGQKGKVGGGGGSDLFLSQGKEEGQNQS